MGECKRDGKQDEDEEMDEAIEAYQPNANFKQLITSLFVFERDSKYIHEYVLQTKTLTKR